MNTLISYSQAVTIIANVTAEWKTLTTTLRDEHDEHSDELDFKFSSLLLLAVDSQIAPRKNPNSPFFFSRLVVKWMCGNELMTNWHGTELNLKIFSKQAEPPSHTRQWAHILSRLFQYLRYN